MESVKHPKASYYLRNMSAVLPSSSSQLLICRSFILPCVFTCHKFTVFSVTKTEYVVNGHVVLCLNFPKACCLLCRTMLTLPTIDNFVVLILEYWIFYRKVCNMCFQKAKVMKHFSLYDSMKIRFQTITKGFKLEKKMQFNKTLESIKILRKL